MRPPLRLGLELAAFAALGGYAAGHWASGLVADADDGRVLACVLIATAAGAAVALAQAVPRAQAALLRGLAALVGLAAGFVAAGLEVRLLAPRNWDELADGLDRGFASLGSVQWPYSGSEPWGATVLLLAIPLALTLAAALAFWGRGGLRPAALVLLLALHGVAVTEHRFDGEIGRGLGLLLLVAAWLWLPRMPERGRGTAFAAAGAVVLAAIVAVPAAARYEDREPWVDYESWNPFAAEAATRFDWSHSYGPIDWPRDGTTLMNVRSDQRHYWKVVTLDRFDGFRWTRSGDGRGNDPLLPQPYREEWETSFRVTIRDLDTDLFPIAGTALGITGADSAVVPSEDGTMAALAGSLEEGDSYSVDAYVPNPTPDQMRAAPRPPGERLSHIPDELIQYTHVALPGVLAATPAQILDSPYADVLRLARRLAEGQATPYDAVRAVQRHLRSEYTYSERPPSRRFPLPAFLFEDRIGYCQQFSGAMALMLRMLGLPARVAGGFTPGSYNRDTGEYRVRDLDAHSWVEVWFTGLGWVPFDPTPSVAPAESQSSADAASAVGGATDAPEQRDTPGAESADALSEGAGGPGTPPGAADPAIEGWMALVALGVGIAAVALLSTSRAADRRRGPREDPDLVALRRALAGAGGPVPPGLTLLALEARLEHDGDAPAARYVRMVRERRFAPGGGRPPDAPARRALRRALARGRGLRARVATYAALPPPAFRRD